MYGIFSAMIRIYSDFIAMFLYPGYDPRIDMISFLGSGPGHMYFNLGLFFSALVLIPYYLSFARVFKNEFPESEKMIHRSLQVSIISAISVSLVGIFLGLYNIFPISLIYDFHGFFATIAFMCAVYSCVITGSLIKKSKRFPQFFAYMCYIVAAVNLVFLFTWHALIEWIASYLLIIMQLSFAVYMLYKKL